MAAVAVAACRQRSGDGEQRIGSATASGMAAEAAILPPRAAAVAMKTPAVTAMAEAQTTINNQLKSIDGNGDGNGNDDDNGNKGDGGGGSAAAAP